MSVFPDLTAETLQRRRELKPITARLRDAKVPYRWVSYYKLSVLHLGKPLQAVDLSSGRELLNTIGLSSLETLPDTPSDKNDQKPSWSRVPATR